MSIITVCYNSEKYIRDAFESVLNQSYPLKEYIVVDGSSKDRTVSIIQKYERNHKETLRWISEPDKGLYDAMNKGVKMATGDIVGILNSDDFFYDEHVLSKIAKAFEAPSIQATIGDIVFVKEEKPNKVVRHYSAKNWTPSKFAWGYMPPHPSFFVRKELFERLGYYQIDYRIAADYELLIRFLLKGQVKWKYLPIITTKMRMGGASTSGLKSLITLNKEIARGCRENQVYTNYAMIYSKYLFKPFEFLKKK
jgi:glycosyltransferase involved in cell wall biosynthesis